MTWRRGRNLVTRAGALALFVISPLFFIEGCNAILGNEEGVLFEDASVATQGDAAERDAALSLADGSSSDVLVTEDDAGGCGAAKKLCDGTCVDKTNALFGCSGPECSPCTLKHATSLCSGSGCAISTCEPGFADCDQRPENGCETDLSLPEHCGSCNGGCTAGAPYCAPSGTTFTCTSGCTGSATLCGSQCADLQSSKVHCGTCGNACPSVGNGEPQCQAGKCTIACGVGFHVCGTSCSSNSDAKTCGASCTPCPTPANATATCDGTQCGFVCKPGTHPCGNECVGNDDPLHCGTSCTACSVPENGTATCDGKSCRVACPPGFHDCSGKCASNTDIATCGASCVACPSGVGATPSCDGKACGQQCQAGLGDCDKNPNNGCETTTSNDDKNCGACGKKCNGKMKCSLGVCVP